MDQKERTLLFGLIGACISGIVLVGVLISFNGIPNPSGTQPTEVSFLDVDKLPLVIATGEPLTFAFFVESHTKERLNYKYTLISGESVTNSGTFTLPDNNNPIQRAQFNKTVIISNLRLNSTLTKLSNSTILETQQTFNGTMGLPPTTQGAGVQIASEHSYLYYPVLLPVGGDHGTLVFNPDNVETFHTITMSRTKVGDLTQAAPGENAVIIEGTRISDAGYDFYINEWTINNYYGNITASQKTIIEKYRYAFKKIVVNIEETPENNPDKTRIYSIYFWIIVSDGDTY